MDLKERFDLGDRAYLDGANHGPMCRTALEAAAAALEGKRDPALIDDADYFTLPERIREAAATLFGCEARDVAIGTGASHGIGLVACGLDWKPGDHVVVPGGEFPANDLPWRALRAAGVEVQLVDPESVIDAIRPQTRVVAVSHVNFANGCRLDIDSIGEACAATDELIYVIDASQSLGAVPFDVAACRADVVAAAGYKWLMSPYGTGLTYVRPGLVDRLRQASFNWLTIAGAEDFNNLVGLEPRQRPGAVRFDAPETAAFIHGAAMTSSLELLVEVGVREIFAHGCALVDRLVEGLPAEFRAASRLEPAARSTILRVERYDGASVAPAVARLRDAGVAVSLRQSGIRFGPGVWSNVGDVDRALAALRAD